MLIDFFFSCCFWVKLALHCLFQLDGHIALSIRGNCAFTEKAKHAEAAGASALLVINDKEGLAFQYGFGLNFFTCFLAL